MPGLHAFVAVQREEGREDRSWSEGCYLFVYPHLSRASPHNPRPMWVKTFNKEGAGRPAGPATPRAQAYP